MALPRTFVSFSSSDIHCYRLMCAWKAHADLNFNFADFQLDQAINSENEMYIKRRCRERIRLSETFALLIGSDTWSKRTYVKWETEVAIEKGCRLIGINLNSSRSADDLCPWFFTDRGALFVPFSPPILAYALENWMSGPTEEDLKKKNWSYFDSIYTALGYQISGNTATIQPKVNPFAPGSQPPSWKR